MSDSDRELFIISDLHLGGTAPKPGSADRRGFRLCTQVDALAKFIEMVTKRCMSCATELVINGDFVDFLAQPQPRGDRWRPFLDDPLLALDSLKEIAEDHKAIFDNLAAVLAAGHRITLMLGNHDVELSFPMLRRWLGYRLGDPEGRLLRFVFDGEAYTVGRCLIEHGNRYEGFNITDYDGLRRHRSAQSRGQAVRKQHCFAVPPGSHLVAELMNPLKDQRFAFVDLLKPEVQAVLPVLLALDPRLLTKASRLFGLKVRAMSRDPVAPVTPRRGGDMNAESSGENSASNPLQQMLEEVLGRDDARAFLDDMPAEERHGGEIASTLPRPKLVALWLALRRLERDRSFERTVETDKHYLQAAQELFHAGFDCVAFGHTHLAKKIPLKGGGVYLNSGTWADPIQLPAPCIDPDMGTGIPALQTFLDRIESNDLVGLIVQIPTFLYVLVQANGQVAQAELRDFDFNRPVLE